MSATGLLERHRGVGGTLEPRFGGEVVRDYGDPGGEYDALRQRVGLVLRTDLGLIRMTGRDPVRMLNGLITNDITKAGPDHAVYGAMLTPKGRMITDLRARVAEGVIVFDYPLAADADLRAHLTKFVPPLFARWTALDESVVAGVYGPESAGVLAGLGGPAGLEEDAAVVIDLEGSPAIAVGTRIAGGEPGFDVWLEAPSAARALDVLEQRVTATGGRLAGFDALETLRVERGHPRFGAELTPETLPAEAYESIGWMPRAVSFSKGCYTGQEVVVRIAHRGHVNRNLRGVLLGEEPAPAARTPIFRPDDEKEVGWITSAVRSPARGETIALGYVRRELGPGDRVRLGSGTGPEAEVAALPFAGSTRRQPGTGEGV